MHFRKYTGFLAGIVMMVAFVGCVAALDEADRSDSREGKTSSISAASSSFLIGENLIQNGDFSNGTANWSANSMVTAVSGKAVIAGDGRSYASIAQTVGTVPGMHRLEFDIVSVHSHATYFRAFMRSSDGAELFGYGTNYASGTLGVKHHSFDFTVAENVVTIQFQHGGNSTVVIDNVSLVNLDAAVPISTPIPPTATPTPLPAATPVPSTPTPIPPTATPVPSTATPVSTPNVTTLTFNCARNMSVGQTQLCTLQADSFPTGVSGYNFVVTFSPVGIVVPVEPSGTLFAGRTVWRTADDIAFAGADVTFDVEPGATNVEMSFFTLLGLQEGSVTLDVIVRGLDEDTAPFNAVQTSSIPVVISVAP